MTIPNKSNQAKKKAKNVRRLGMVGWYNPRQLIRTGIEVIVSTVFGKHSDSRRLDAFASDQPFIDYRKQKYLNGDGSFGFDYVADTGDGWNPTYAVAYALAQPALTPPKYPPLPRGKLLIFGGDLVYPYPTRDLYQNRLVAPYALAGQIHRDESVEVLAIPGNHDWYDSLVNFKKLFCTQDKFGSRQTRQTRSYFAARLPGNWWLLGVDVQLEGDIDEPQFKFFCNVVDNDIRDDNLVILCIPEPIWHQRWERSDTSSNTHTLLENLEQRIGKKLRISIAGDLHHYQRHSTKDNRHLVTCGTGGAFLHPTHKMPTDPTMHFSHEKSFPKIDVSRKLTFWNLRFVTRNPMFGIVTATAYLLAAWQNGLAVGECFGLDSDPDRICIKEMGRLGLSNWWDAITAGAHSALLNPTGLALYGFIFAGFIFFADKRSTWFRYIVGTLHSTVHIIAGFLIYWFGAYVTVTLAELTPKSIPQYLLTGSIIIILAWILGSIILGVYLLISLNIFGMHRTEAFSSLRIQDWKGFLRFRIDNEGLHMRFIGFNKVPRQWDVVTLRNGHKILKPAYPSSLVGEVRDQIDIPMQQNRNKIFALPSWLWFRRKCSRIE